MSRGIRLLGAAGLAVLVMAGATGPAVAETVFDSGLVTVMAATKAVRVDVGGITVVSVDKVSDPGVQVRVTVSEGTVPVVSTAHPAGTHGCSTADNPAGGTLNRTVVVQGGASANVYMKAQYTNTTPAGVATTTVLEPLGPSGTTLVTGGLLSGLPVDICVS